MRRHLANTITTFLQHSIYFSEVVLEAKATCIARGRAQNVPTVQREYIKINDEFI